jgi:polar amino acid transport system substrate-binding protein
MIRPLRLLAVLVVAIAAAGCASLGGGGTPVLSRVVESGELRVGVSGNQPPLNAVNRAGEIFGLEADLARMLATSMGVEVRFVKTPFPELLDTLKAGQIDLVMSGVTITPERNLRVAFVGPYFVSGKSILTKSRTLALADEAGDIDRSSVRLAALGGSTSQRFVEVFAPRAQLVTTSSYDEAVNLIRQDRVDAVVADYPICVLSALRYPRDGMVTLASPLTLEPIGIALPASDPLFVNLIQNYLNALQATGVLGELQSKWFEDGSWLAELP